MGELNFYTSLLTFIRVVELCVDGLLTSFFIQKYKQKYKKRIQATKKT